MEQGLNLTKIESSIWKKLKQSENFIRSYNNPDGEFCYRIISSDFSPIMNIKPRNMNNLISLNRVVRQKDGTWKYNKKWHKNNKNL